MLIKEAVAAVGFAARVLTWLHVHWGEIRLRFQSYVVYRNRRVRVSMASLLRITLRDQYLLVRGHRIPDQYQPPGGVYKFYPGAKNILDALGLVGDVFLKDDVDSKDDLRRVLQRGSRLPAFLEWFHSRENRELDPRREFHDELVATGILDADLFADLRTRWVRSVGVGIRFSPELDIPEYLFADVFEVLLAPEQENALLELQRVESDQYRFVDERCIGSYGQSCGIRVGSHTWKIVPGAKEPARRS